MRDLDDYQMKYKSEPGEKHQVILRKRHVVSIMDKYPHDSILEVGCGMNPLFLADFTYETMTIVEPGHDFISIAQMEAEKKQANVKCIESTFEDSVAELNKMHFDYIVVSSLLHELESPEVFMRNLATIVDEKTVVHINVPNAYSLHKIIAKNMGLIDDVHELSAQQKEMQRNRCYDMSMLIEFVEEFGFEVIEKGSFIPKFLTGKQMDRMLEEGIIQEEFYTGLDELIDYIPDLGSEIYVQIRLSNR